MGKFKKVIIIYILIFLLFAGLCKTIQKDYEVIGTTSYMVLRGDTLWSIAEAHARENVDIRYYVNLIQDYNENLSSDIQIGQIINLPIISER